MLKAFMMYVLFLVLFLIFGVAVVLWFNLDSIALFFVVKGSFAMSYVVCEIFAPSR